MRFIGLLCCLLCSLGAGPQTRSAAAPQTRPPAPVINEVLAAQVALDRVGFSTGEIDGRSGQNVQRALSAFQQSQQLSPTGQMDDVTWKQLTSAGGDVPPLVEYTLTAANFAGPFTPDIPPKLPDQAALDELNYRTPLEAIAGKARPAAWLRRQHRQCVRQRAASALRRCASRHGSRLVEGRSNQSLSPAHQVS
jgi:peptidoglycan hydrolase-like protein with peptidoglycan-binding domain